MRIKLKQRLISTEQFHLAHDGDSFEEEKTQWGVFGERTSPCEFRPKQQHRACPNRGGISELSLRPARTSDLALFPMQLKSTAGKQVVHSFRGLPCQRQWCQANATPESTTALVRTSLRACVLDQLKMMRDVSMFHLSRFSRSVWGCFYCSTSPRVVCGLGLVESKLGAEG
jgi:hypothetical protein